MTPATIGDSTDYTLQLARRGSIYLNINRLKNYIKFNLAKIIFIEVKDCKFKKIIIIIIIIVFK